MFNKEANQYVKKIELTNKEFYKQYNNVFITPVFVNMLNKYYEDKDMQNHLDYDERKKSYIDRIFEYQVKNYYNEAICNLYHDGKIIINNEDYYLKDFYIVFSNKNDFHLMCTDNKYHNEKIEYNKAIKFIDTTAFLKFINDYQIDNNTIKIDNMDDILNIIKNWDGLLHDKVVETDAIINKEIIGNDL